MSKFLHKGICLMLALVLALTVLPAVAPKVSAELNPTDLGSFGVVLYEEHFNYADYATYLANGGVDMVHLANAGTTAKAIQDGCFVATRGASGNSDDGFTFPVEVPAYATSGMGVNIEVRAKALNGNGTLRFLHAGYTNDGFACSVGSAVKQQVALTAGAEFGVYSCNLIANSNQSSVGINFRRANVSGGAIVIDYIKVTLICLGDDPTTGLNYCLDKGYSVKLNEDVTVTDTLSMENGAELDLNGHTLTASKLTAMPGSQVVDNGDTKGKLAMESGNLEFLGGENAMLPLYNGTDGYVFVDSPELGYGDQYEWTSTSYDGFTLQFRPGFGSAEIREQYLSGLESGIKMNVELGWIDAFGNPGESNVFNADNLLGMYANEYACGEISVTGAQEYKDISVTVSIESCGVICELDPMTFTNDKVTYHQLGHDFTPTGANTKLTDKGVFTTDAGKTLVIDFDFQFNGNYVPEFCFAVRNYDEAANIAILCANGYQNTSGYTLVASLQNRVNSETPYVNVRFVLNMETGEYNYQFGDLVKGGTNANLPALFEGDKDFRFVAPKVGGVDTYGDYTIENLLIYTVNTPANTAAEN